MPEKPVPENDPLVQKSMATWYVVTMVILTASLFWALWDEDFGQRPWKAFQHEWKDRYSAFLKTARSTSAQSEKEVEEQENWIGDSRKVQATFKRRYCFGNRTMGYRGWCKVSHGRFCKTRIQSLFW